MYSSVVKDSQRIFFNFGWDGTSIPDIARALHRTAFPVNQNPQRAAQVLIRRFFAACEISMSDFGLLCCEAGIATTAFYLRVLIFR